MQRTSVFVSQHGSTCFHALFMPKGAHLVLVEDDTTRYTLNEARLFYKHLPWLKTRTYSFPKEGKKASAAAQEPLEVNNNIFVDIPQIVELVNTSLIELGVEKRLPPLFRGLRRSRQSHH
eukprot:3387734-Pyramimonas_sp.AAC.1